MSLTALALVIRLLGLTARVEPPVFWEGRGPAYASVDAVVAGDNDETVFAAARDMVTGASALFRTSDGGQSWEMLAPAPAGERIRQVVIDPADSRRMFALTTFAPQGANIYRSDDAGTTWRLKTTLTQADGREDLFFDPTRPDLAFLDAWNANLGTRALSSSLEDGPWTPIAFDATASSAWIAPDGTLLWAAQFRHCARIPCYPGSSSYWQDEIHFSKSAGQTFQTTGGTAPCLRLDVSYDPSNPSLAYGSGSSCPDLVRSEDGGKTWEQWDPAGSLAALLRGSEGLRIARTAVTSTSSGVVYALALATVSTDPGAILASRDGARSWDELPNPPGSLTAMALGPSGALYVGTSAGVFRAQRTHSVQPRSE